MAFSISTLVETHQGLSLIQLGDLGVGRSRVPQSVQTSVPCLSELLSYEQSGGGFFKSASSKECMSSRQHAVAVFSDKAVQQLFWMDRTHLLEVVCGGTVFF